jgi:hypothetical protein
VAAAACLPCVYPWRHNCLFYEWVSVSPVMRSVRASSPQLRTPVQGVFSGCQGSVIQLALAFETVAFLDKVGAPLGRPAHA